MLTRNIQENLSERGVFTEVDHLQESIFFIYLIYAAAAFVVVSAARGSCKGQWYIVFI